MQNIDIGKKEQDSFSILSKPAKLMNQQNVGSIQDRGESISKLYSDNHHVLESSDSDEERKQVNPTQNTFAAMVFQGPTFSIEDTFSCTLERRNTANEENLSERDLSTTIPRPQ